MRRRAFYEAGLSYFEGSVDDFEGSVDELRTWSFTTSDDRLLAYWDFNNAGDEAVVVDLVQSAVGQLQGGAAYTEDTSGRTGNAGDRAIDFGETSAQQLIQVEPVEWLKLASDQN